MIKHAASLMLLLPNNLHYISLLKLQLFVDGFNSISKMVDKGVPPESVLGLLIH